MNEIFDLIKKEREYQDQKWGKDFDDNQNDQYKWVAYIGKYATKWALIPNPFDPTEFKNMMVKVAALAVAAIEWCNRKYGV